jgi:hypothetical protein
VAPKLNRLTLVLVVVFALIAGAVVLYLNPAAEEYRSVRSPSGDYVVVVRRYPPRLPTMPGQGSDAPGVLRLYDRHGRLVNESELPMVSIADQIEWGPDYVAVPGLFQWPLGRVP